MKEERNFILGAMILVGLVGNGVSARAELVPVIWGWNPAAGDMNHVRSGIARISASDTHVVMLTEERLILTKGLGSGSAPAEATDGMAVDVVAGTGFSLALKEDPAPVDSSRSRYSRISVVLNN